MRKGMEEWWRTRQGLLKGVWAPQGEGQLWDKVGWLAPAHWRTLPGSRARATRAHGRCHCRFPRLSPFFSLLLDTHSGWVSPPRLVHEVWFTEGPDDAPQKFRRVAPWVLPFFSALCALFHGVVSLYKPSRRDMHPKQPARSLWGQMRRGGQHSTHRVILLGICPPPPHLPFTPPSIPWPCTSPMKYQHFKAGLRLCFLGDQG